MEKVGFAVIVAIVFFVIGLNFGAEIQRSAWQAETIQRNLALYCPDDGAWAWKGECEE